ncbi:MULTISPECIES: hypothetical protein [Flavobacteriaceae]|uniref:Uncharacterized protein n=2 Tax=Flavobacteriaceae TaxID=49546 RepID=A0A4Y8ANA9_9FLAO|nr:MULTISPECIES: hypothetical protein [Flavobacteriaceae]TEW71833.1 hypothetical protein E2488_15305 [Gramella jeungdoensis]GGK60127.1 hypothetical protein GCM10007963_30340 [Lutibacter litoralis]
MQKTNKKSSLLIGSVIVFLIVITPYLLYFYQSVPILNPDPTFSEDWDTIFGVIKGGYYVKAHNYIYYFFSKFVPLLLLFIWFITNKHWWVHAIAIPISVYLFQLIAVINDSVEYVDEVEFIYTVPIAVIIITILYFIRGKMSIYIQAVDLKQEMDENMKDPQILKK